MIERKMWTNPMVTLALVALGSLGLMACGDDEKKVHSGPKGDLGSVSVELQVGDVDIDSVDYTIDGNGYYKSGKLPVSGATVSGRVDGIPSAEGYELGLTASGEGVQCSGSATFDIVAGETTSVSVVLNCRVGPRTGGILIGGKLNFCPQIDFISALPARASIGNSVALTTVARDSDNLPEPLTYSWVASAGELTGNTTSAASLKCIEVGESIVELTVDDGDCETVASTRIICTEEDEEEPVETAMVRINEMVSTGGIPGDWVELYNLSDSAADISGWTFKDDDDSHAYVIPAGTVIPAYGTYVLEESAFGFGLGKADSARIYDRSLNLIDSFTQPAHGSPSWGRCPDGTGPFAQTLSATKGAANACAAPPSAEIVINEMNSNVKDPGDWVELYNKGTVAGDISGWTFKDDDDSHAYVIPAGTVIPANGYYVLEEAAFDFGLGKADSARLYDLEMNLVDSFTQPAHGAPSWGRCPNGVGDFAQTLSLTKGAANDCAAPVLEEVVFNEVVTNGAAHDYFELFNPTAAAIDLSGWTFRDNSDSHNFVFPAGTVIAAGGFLAFETDVDFDFGLGDADSLRLFDEAMNLIDSYSWTTHRVPSFSRCPDGHGDWTQTPHLTPGAANNCDEYAGGFEFQTWPGGDEVVISSTSNQFGSNLSGLFYETAAGSEPTILWGVLNSPSKIYRMSWNDSTSTWADTSGWSGGKQITYLDGSGNPDAEGITRAELDSPGIYVAAERNNNQSGTSAPTVLRYDISAPGATLTATNEWNLIADLPVLGANLGPEAITWVPDAFLVQRGFVDESTNALYDPNDYPDHGTGIFFVGLEQNGMIYGYALNHADNSFTRVATIDSGFAGVMDLSFDRDVGYLWSYCDNTCDNKATILDIDTTPDSATFGNFQILKGLSTPAALPNSNFEGIGIAPESECVDGYKTFVWADDDQAGGFSLREGTVACGRF